MSFIPRLNRDAKGIMHTHASAMAWAKTSTAAFGLQPDDRLSNYAPLHFDLSTLDLLGSALLGATMVMIRRALDSGGARAPPPSLCSPRGLRRRLTRRQLQT